MKTSPPPVGAITQDSGGLGDRLVEKWNVRARIHTLSFREKCLSQSINQLTHPPLHTHAVNLHAFFLYVPFPFFVPSLNKGSFSLLYCHHHLARCNREYILDYLRKRGNRNDSWTFFPFLRVLLIMFSLLYCVLFLSLFPPSDHHNPARFETISIVLGEDSPFFLGRKKKNPNIPSSSYIPPIHNGSYFLYVSLIYQTLSPFPSFRSAPPSFFHYGKISNNWTVCYVVRVASSGKVEYCYYYYLSSRGAERRTFIAALFAFSKE